MRPGKTFKRVSGDGEERRVTQILAEKERGEGKKGGD